MRTVSEWLARGLLLAATILFVLGIVLSTQAEARTGSAERPEGEANQPGVTYELPLAKLRSEEGPIWMRGTHSIQTIHIPIPERLEIQEALLHLELQNSIALLEDRSQLIIRLDDRVIAQVPLRPTEPDGVVDVRLPLEMLEPGYRRLQLEVNQHYTLECEDFLATELWTQIDPVKSTLALRANPRPIDPRLSRLDTLVDPKLWQWTDRTLDVLVSPSPLADDHLRWGALATQGAALRLDYEPPEIRQVGTLERRGSGERDLIAVGTRDELAKVLPEEIVRQIDGSFLGVFPAPDAPSELLLVVSGETAEEVERAALTLSALNFPFPDRSTLKILATELPELPEHAIHDFVEFDSRYALSQFGFATKTARGAHSEPFRIELWFPPDVFADDESRAELALHFAYGAGLRDDSSFEVRVNGDFQRAIRLDEENGAAYRRYRLHLPLRSFEPGKNVVELVPLLVPSQTGECLLVQDRNLLFTLFDDSTIEFPPTMRYVRLPDFRRFARTGFPYSQHPYGSDVSLHVADRSPEAVAASWMLLAKLSQKIGLPLPEAEISFNPLTEGRHLLVVGTDKSLAPELAAAAPIQLREETIVAAHPSRVRNRESVVERSWLRDILPDGFFASPAIADPGDPPTLARVEHGGNLGETVLAMSFHSPYGSDAASTVFLADTSERLAEGMRLLIQPELWENLQGDTVVWRNDPGSMASQSAASSFHLGDVDSSEWLRYRFIRSPWAWMASVLAAGVLLAVMSWTVLERYRRRHHPNGG